MSQQNNEIVTGYEAIEIASSRGIALWKFEDPTEESRQVTEDEAREIAAIDPSLIALIPSRPGVAPWDND